MYNTQIFKCRICQKLMKRNSFQVYPGDSTCCNQCNREADEESAPFNPLAHEDNVGNEVV